MKKSFVAIASAIAMVFPVGTSETLLALSAGVGTAADPFVIADCSELQEIDDLTSNLSKIFVLGANIDCTGVTFSPLKNATTYFSGVFDGRGFEISGLSISCSTDDCGLFARLSGATVKNLRFISPIVTSSAKYVGLIAGRGTSSLLIDNVEILGGTVTNTYAASASNHRDDSFSGGILGHYSSGSGVISRVTHSMEVSGKSSTGGIVGYSTTSGTLTVSDVVVSGNVAGLRNVGGIAGYASTGGSGNSLTVTRATVTASSVEGLGQSIGGILGFGWNVTITDSFSSASVSGKASGTAVNVQVADGQGAYVGGIAGQISGGDSTIQDTGSTGDVFADGVDGTVVALGVSGVLGYARLTNFYVTRVFHRGNITGWRGVGAVAGMRGARTFVTDSYFRSNLSIGDPSTSMYGGLDGQNSGNITLTRSYYVGTQLTLSAANRVAVTKFDGSARIACSSFFFDKEVLGSDKTSLTNDRCGGNGGPAALTTLQMKTASTFIDAGWNFTQGSAVWSISPVINDGYPFLSSAGLDTNPPAASIISPSSLSSSRTLVYTVVFDETINGLSSSDFSNVGTASCTFAVPTSSGTSFSVTVTCTTDGTVIMRLAPNSVTDAALNTGPTSAVLASSVTIDSPPPTTVPTQTTAPTDYVAPTQAAMPPVGTAVPSAGVPSVSSPAAQGVSTTVVPPTTVLELAPTTTTSVAPSTTTTTLPSVDVPEVADGGGALVVNGQRIEATITRENNQLVIAAGVLRARISAVQREGGRAPLDSQGRIRMDQGDSIEIEVTGFGTESQVEVRMYSDPVLLGRSTVSALGNLAASYEVPDSVDDGRHTVVLLGESQQGEELTFALAVFIGAESTGPSTLALLVGIPLGLAVIAALIIPAIIRRRRKDEEEK